MSLEKKLLIGLAVTVLSFLFLVGSLAYNLGWSLLAISSLIFGLIYPLVWMAWKVYQFWREPIMQLTTYTQVIREGIGNIKLTQQAQHGLFFELQREISRLVKHHQQQTEFDQSIESLLNQIMDSWSIPICLFDQQLKLSYRNPAMNDCLQQPMLVGKSAYDLGFKLQNDLLSHPQFDSQWQCQTINYQNQNQQYWLFSALDISKPLYQNEMVTQRNLIRVLGHELRNSLTPMASMADTLLSSEKFDEKQVRLVLSRIQKRSERLLAFVGRYADLSQLPKPSSCWFNLNELIDEVSSITEDKCQVVFTGQSQCFADPNQISQLLVNLFKNAYEANEKNTTTLSIKAYCDQNNQILQIIDNGPGFANLENVMTPFYTTKLNGSGIGLPFCAEIIRNHDGQFSVSNAEHRGAKISMSWPFVHMSI